MTCKTHPDAPHGFVRGASHSEDRYVCECEFWEEPKMNERIAKLYDQAIIIEDGGDYVCGELDPVKFAELIVRECIDYCGENLSKTVGGALKIHFGVEE